MLFIIYKQWNICETTEDRFTKYCKTWPNMAHQKIIKQNTYYSSHDYHPKMIKQNIYHKSHDFCLPCLSCDENEQGYI